MPHKFFMNLLAFILNSAVEQGQSFEGAPKVKMTQLNDAADGEKPLLSLFLADAHNTIFLVRQRGKGMLLQQCRMSSTAALILAFLSFLCFSHHL